MSLQNIKSAIGDYAKDTRINIGNVLTEEGAEGLKLNQISGIALATAYATKNAVLIENLKAELEGNLSEAEIQATKAAASIMAMNNIYYRFVHLTSDKEINSLPANLRMQGLQTHGIEHADFELYSLAVSAINGCGMCMDAHVAQVLKAGVSKVGVQSSIRIASVLNAAAQAIDIGK